MQNVFLIFKKLISLQLFFSSGFSFLHLQSLFAVFDGHGGDYTSRFLERHFASCFESILSNNSTSSKKSENDVKIIESSLRDVCLAMNERLAQDPKMRTMVVQKRQEEKTKEERLPTEKDVEDDVENVNNIVKKDGQNDSKEEGEEDNTYSHTIGKNSLSGGVQKTDHPMDGSGACGVVVVVTSTHLVVAHVGDCRCLVQRRGAPGVGNESGGDANGSLADNAVTECGIVKTLTNDHTCRNRVDEKTRVEKAGGFVDPLTGRIYLTKKRIHSREPSRAWGDFMFMHHGIICLPEITVVDREPNSTELLVLGCDGIFEGQDRNANTIASCLLNASSSNGTGAIARMQLLAQQDKQEAKDSSNGPDDGNGGLTVVSMTQSPPPSTGTPVGTPTTRITNVTVRPTTDEICRDLRAECERVMLQGLERGCMDNQTMCVALLCPAALKHV